MIFTGADLDGRGPESYVAGPGLQQVGRALDVEVSRPRNVQTFRVAGLPGASASATVRQGGRQADLGLAVIETGNAAYRFIFLSAGQMSRDEARAYQAYDQQLPRAGPGGGRALPAATDRGGRGRGGRKGRRGSRQPHGDRRSQASALRDHQRARAAPGHLPG